VATSVQNLFSRSSRQFFSGIAGLALFGFTAASMPAFVPAEAQVVSDPLYGPSIELVASVIESPTVSAVTVEQSVVAIAPQVAAPVVEQAPAVAAPAVSAPVAESLVASAAPVAAPAPVFEAAPVAAAPAPAVEKMPFQNMIQEAALKQGLPPEFLAAALDRESAGFKDKYVYGWHVDGTGRGIAGIDKKYHPEVSDDEAFDPYYSINWMANELGKLNRKHGNTYDASREYNGGPAFSSSRIGYGGSTVNELTKRHADTIQEMARKYRPIFA
jgi:hypothetical protein